MSCQTEAMPVPDNVNVLTPITFSTDGVERRHQLDLWRATYEPFNHLEMPDAAALADGFVARNEVWPLGGMADPLQITAAVHHHTWQSGDPPVV